MINRKRWIICTLWLFATIILVSCAPKEEVSERDMQSEHDWYYSLNKQLQGKTVEEASILLLNAINQLEEEKINYQKLISFKTIVTEDIGLYLEIMVEEEEFYFDENQIVQHIPKMLERAVRLEAFLKEYPTSKAVGKVEELYKKYVTEVVTGGDSEWAISKNGYLAEDGFHIYNTVL